jgi:hypothetical protein
MAVELMSTVVPSLSNISMQPVAKTADAANIESASGGAAENSAQGFIQDERGCISNEVIGRLTHRNRALARWLMQLNGLVLTTSRYEELMQLGNDATGVSAVGSNNQAGFEATVVECMESFMSCHSGALMLAFYAAGCDQYRNKLTSTKDISSFMSAACPAVAEIDAAGKFEVVNGTVVVEMAEIKVKPRFKAATTQLRRVLSAVLWACAVVNELARTCNFEPSLPKHGHGVGRIFFVEGSEQVDMHPIRLTEAITIKKLRVKV